MDSLGLVVHDDQSFFTKVVNLGIEQGIFTRDRADELIRISIAMANKYVLHKEVDFRSPEELAKVQETVLKLVGVGLEIKSKGNDDEGVRLLMQLSPVDLFRLAYTRIEKLRNSWRRLLLNHRVEILVSSKEFECLSDLTCQRLAEMSVLTEDELYTIRSITLEDELFSSLTLMEYYESELERYEFLLRLRSILPFALLNRSPNVRADNLSEVDTVREALINTLLISAFMNCPDPVAVSTGDVRDFLAALGTLSMGDMLPEELEDVVVELIHELGEGLEESDVSLLTTEMVRTCKKLLDTIEQDWDTVSAASAGTFFKRWTRMVILSDVPDPIEDILSSEGLLDEYAFSLLCDQIMNLPENDALALIERFPWNRLVPNQIIRLFHEIRFYQQAFAARAVLKGFGAVELADLIEGLEPDIVKDLKPALHEALSEAAFGLEDLEVLVGLPHGEGVDLLRVANPPIDLDRRQILVEFREGSLMRRRALFFSCWGSEHFPDLFLEAWSNDPAIVKQLVKAVQPHHIGSLLLSAAGGHKPRVIETEKGRNDLLFDEKEVNGLYRSLPQTKKKAALSFFSGGQVG